MPYHVSIYVQEQGLSPKQTNSARIAWARFAGSAADMEPKGRAHLFVAQLPKGVKNVQNTVQDTY